MSKDFTISTGRAGLVLALAFAVGGCAAPAQPGAGPGRPAHVSVVNLTDYRWRIEVTGDGGSRHRTELLAPRGSAELDVPAGSYQIEQSIDSPLEWPVAPRRFKTDLAAGRTYHWPLATLQSDNGDDRPPPKSGG